ncbi:DUF7836 family putative zinc-binding protein [Halococcoides cellulosivorans]|uniref:DUF7836 domain-containing protein n=1 Tax=Halococcoides cellulosivorans TaxID=1679096 RepID=A0A2R4X216_9EURY|nr:hypothetical protein [Halococcoides cellulosivorans]AWB27831.1 hypothetical protein HARCEL1_08965 [Halococcoides cellulosivorans]
MEEAWIQLTCPDCDHEYSKTATTLPGPDATHTCDDCDGAAPLSEFTRTARDLEILRSLRA